jgi:hypothetical protein
VKFIIKLVGYVNSQSVANNIEIRLYTAKRASYIMRPEKSAFTTTANEFCFVDTIPYHYCRHIGRRV